MWEIKPRVLSVLFLYFYSQRNIMQKNDLSMFGVSYSFLLRNIN